MLLSRLMNPVWSVCFEGDGTGGGGDGGGSGTDSGTDNANSGGQTGGTGGDDKTFSQADIDRIVGERAKRAGEAAVAKILQDMGFQKAEDLKAAVDAQRQAEDAKKSELQKLQDGLKAAADEKARAEQERDEARTEKDGILIRHAIELKAVELGFGNPRDAYELLLADESLESVEISDAGKVSGYEKALEELAKSGRLPMKAGVAGSGLGTPPKKTPSKQGQGTQQTEPAKPVVRF